MVLCVTGGASEFPSSCFFFFTMKNPGKSSTGFDVSPMISATYFEVFEEGSRGKKQVMFGPRELTSKIDVSTKD